MSRKLSRIVSEADLDRITAAVKSAEAGTAGEIAVVIAPHSRSWLGDGWLPAAALGLISGIVYLYVARYRGWGTLYPFGRATIVGGIVFGLALLVFGIWAFRPAQTARATWRNALKHFHALRPTRAETAVLILVSVEERQVAVVADRGIAGKVPSDYWDTPRQTIARSLNEGRLAEGLIAAVGEIGIHLAQHFPRPADDRNELPDRPQVG